MKKVLFLFLILFTLVKTNSFSQVTCDIGINFMTPVLDTITISDSILYFEIRFRNYGPGTVTQSDSFYRILTINNIQYNFDGSKYISHLRGFPGAFPAMGYGLTGLISFPIDSIYNLSVINTVCYEFNMSDSSIQDSDTTNNIDCFVFKYNFASISEKQIEKYVNVLQLDNKVQVINSKNEKLLYQVISIDGRVIKSGELYEFVEINLNKEASGIYILNVYNLKENYSTKLFKY